jgi:hypothetical protein
MGSSDNCIQVASGKLESTDSSEWKTRIRATSLSDATDVQKDGSARVEINLATRAKLESVLHTLVLSQTQYIGDMPDPSIRVKSRYNKSMLPSCNNHGRLLLGNYLSMTIEEMSSTGICIYYVV